tara:strand:+ start:664 stop:870 length:207 start_codon:yes stop_codon:yes gene_type:complete
MSLLTNINGVPLYSTIQEALNWAASKGLSGYHTHQYQGQTGYMGGINHNQATDVMSGITPQSLNSSSY